MTRNASSIPSSLPEGRQLHDAVDRQRTPELGRKSEVNPKQAALLRRAVRLADSDVAEGLKIARKALAMDEGSAPAHHVMGLLLDKSGRISAALEHYEKSWRLDPEDADLYTNLGLAAWKLDLKEVSEKFFRIGMVKRPGRVEDAINLAGVLRDLGKFDDAIEILRQAIYLDQTDKRLWNTLGSVLTEAGDPVQAQTFYREAITLDPEWARAWHNLAYTLDIDGQLEDAAQAYRKALEDPESANDAAQMHHGLAFALLGMGQLAEGWDEYDVRLQMANVNAQVFSISAPRWDRDPAALKGKRVLLVGEQGVGDEVLFMNAARDLADAIGPDGKLLVACEKRLIRMIERAFPDADVGPHATIEAEGRKIRAVRWLESEGGCDLWTPMADAVCAFRRKVEDFPDTIGFLPPDPDRVAEMRAKLDALGPGLKVGIVWKSLLMTPSRAKYFSPFKQWAPVLKTPGVVFVNMQYGEVDAEIRQARNEYGVEVHQIPGLNVKDDLDGVAALGAALDITIGPMTASTNLAAAAGGETWILAYKRHWPGLGSGRMPWYPNARTLSPEGWGLWDGCMQQVAQELSQRTGGEGSGSAVA